MVAALGFEFKRASSPKVLPAVRFTTLTNQTYWDMMENEDMFSISYF